jgi:DNA polymerase I-like protein with 3'-5' exonuclease and polymerase domains
MTFRHRRNSILGGGVDWEDEEEEMEKGFLANVREDGRIATPADTCGASTARFKHRGVANIPRVSSQYGENMRAMFGVDEDYFLVGYDFDSLEARIEAHYCYKFDDEEKSYCKSLIAKKPLDVHTLTAKAIAEVLGREFKRDPAKNIKYGCTYGAQANKLVKMLGCDSATAELIFRTFWTKAKPLKTFITALENYWEKNGKKYIRGIDGRKVPTRAKHALANSAFQSAGVICAKRAMVIHDKLLKDRGYAVDFWTQDWKNMDYLQQIIAYHDEAQSEVTKGLVKFKSFDTEEEALAFKQTRKDLSDIGHSKDGKYYVALCIPGYLATEAVRMAGEYYKLNVALSSGYMVHKNWAGTH